MDIEYIKQLTEEQIHAMTREELLDALSTVILCLPDDRIAEIMGWR